MVPSPSLPRSIQRMISCQIATSLSLLADEGNRKPRVAGESCRHGPSCLGNGTGVIHHCRISRERISHGSRPQHRVR
jgi:hypothetical protein